MTILVLFMDLFFIHTIQLKLIDFNLELIQWNMSEIPPVVFQ